MISMRSMRVNSLGKSRIEPASPLSTVTLPFGNKHCSRRTSLTRVIRHVPHLPEGIIDELWNAPDRLIDEGQMLKDGDRCTVVRVDHSNAHQQRDYVLKRFNLRGAIHTLLHSCMKTRARNCWQRGRILIDNGIRTPFPLAFLEHQVGPLKTRSYVLTQYVAGTPLLDFVAKNRVPDNTLRTLATEFAHIWHRFEANQITHGDMKATNFLVTPDLRLFVIDLDAMQQRRSKHRFQRHHRKDWDRFMKNWRRQPKIAKAFVDAVASLNTTNKLPMYRASA